ncbi:MAG: RNA-binding protein [Desulfoarculaceae bacterium]|nr:RNA-binding protein [Desulfoarculaceae bacterium]
MRIYVSNLSYQVTAEDLRGAFITFKNVGSIFIIKDRTTGKSKGFGYVDISPDSEAQSAIDLLHGKMLQGRPMALKVALPPLEKREGASPRTLSRANDSRGKQAAGSKAPKGRGNKDKSGDSTNQDQNRKKRRPGRRSGQGGGPRH